ncbi:MAG: LacI family DNA-binding transcriptional regulator [Clostridia bacterium]|nr:LacI family DNA-binding transcriptional regulator [Clostridia bacterium]
MNIYDIAEKSGVSIATVSRVLNDSPNVRAATRERVLEVIRAEGYTPNAFARGLGLGSMRMVGILCTSVRDPFYAQAVGHVEEHFRRNGLNAILRCTGPTTEEKKQALEYMTQKNVDAIVLIGSIFCEDEDNSHIAAAAQQVPIIIINGHIDLPGVYCVTSDERKAVCDLVEALFRRHKKRILFLHDIMTYSCQQKIAGYRDGCALFDEPVDDALIVPVERNLDAVNDCIKRLLVQGVSFDAVVGAEDILALGAQKSLHRIGLNMPIIGFNNSTLARCATPELTSIDNGLEQMCTIALGVLDTLLEKKEASRHTVVPAKLVERDSFRAN